MIVENNNFGLLRVDNSWTIIDDRMPELAAESSRRAKQL